MSVSYTHLDVYKRQERSYVSTGQYDAKVNEVLGCTTRTGANSASSALGNGQASNGYAIKGCLLYTSRCV